LKLFIDNNLAPRIARSLNALLAIALQFAVKRKDVIPSSGLSMYVSFRTSAGAIFVETNYL
jgi:hypothetical protein